MKKLLIGLFAVSTLSLAQANCTYDILCSNCGKDLKLAKQIMKKAGYHYQKGGSNTLYFSSSYSTNQPYPKKVLTEVTIRNNDSDLVYENYGAVNDNHIFRWRKSVSKAFRKLPACDQE
jgi:hypothetical protein